MNEPCFPRCLGLLGWLLLAMPICAQPIQATDPEAVVAGQLAAFNEGDVDAYLQFFAPNIRVYKFPDELVSEGLEALRAVYANAFATYPDAHAVVTERRVHGKLVIDNERVTGITADGTPFLTTAIYEVENGKIVRFWFIQ